jgi:hypothetical protein
LGVDKLNKTFDIKENYRGRLRLKSVYHILNLLIRLYRVLILNQYFLFEESIKDNRKYMESKNLGDRNLVEVFDTSAILYMSKKIRFGIGLRFVVSCTFADCIDLFVWEVGSCGHAQTQRFFLSDPGPCLVLTGSSLILA